MRQVNEGIGREREEYELERGRSTSWRGESLLVC